MKKFTSEKGYHYEILKFSSYHIYCWGIRCCSCNRTKGNRNQSTAHRSNRCSNRIRKLSEIDSLMYFRVSSNQSKQQFRVSNSE